MAAVTAAAVNELRKKTGVSMMLCKEALTASDGDQDKAVAYIREKGIATQSSRSDRETASAHKAHVRLQLTEVGKRLQLRVLNRNISRGQITQLCPPQVKA